MTDFTHEELDYIDRALTKFFYCIGVNKEVGKSCINKVRKALKESSDTKKDIDNKV